MLINTVSKHYHISVRTLRYYEEIGLIKADRNENNLRQYKAQELEKLETILLFKSLGFKLSDIKTILNDDQALNQLLYDQLEATNIKIQDLVHHKHALENLIHTFKGSHVTTSRLLAYLNEQIYVKDERWLKMTNLHSYTIAIGTALVPIALETTDHNLLEKIRQLRAQLKKQHQLDLPLIRVRDVEALEPLSYQIQINDQQVHQKNFDSCDIPRVIDDIMTQLKAIVLS